MKQLAKGSQDPNIVKEVYGSTRSVAIMRLSILIGFLLLASFALGQAGGVFQGSTAIAGNGNVLRTVPHAQIVVCGYPSTGSSPCTNTVTTYTTPGILTACPLNAPVLIPGTATCSGTSDAAGNFSFIVAAGQNIAYYFKYLTTWYGPYVTSIGIGGGSSADFASPPPLGNVTPNTVDATTVTAVGDGLFFQPQSNCIFEGSDPTLHEIEDVSGNLMWLYQGLGGPCTQILNYTPLPDGVNPTDKQVPAWNAASGHWTIQNQTTSAAIDVRDAGVDCTGVADSGAALNTLFANINGRQVTFPDVCSIKTTVQLVIQSQSQFVLHGNGHMVGTGGFVGPIIYGCNAAASGPVLYINRSGYGRIEGIGITARGPSGCSTSTFTGSVQVDSTGNPGVTTHNITFDNDGFTTSAQGGSTPANYIGISITDGGKQNGEMIRVKNSWIHCQNSTGSIGVDLENPTSDKDVFESNNISSCFIGVKHANGNATIKDNLFSSDGNFSVFGSNGAVIYNGSCSSGPINILNNEVDSSGDFINSANDGVGAGCNSGLNIEGNELGISDPTPNNYVINIGNCCVQGYNLIGNQFLVTSNTSQYLVGSASQGLFGPLGHLYDLNNSLRTPTGSNSLGFTNLNYPFQQGEYHAPLSGNGGTLNVTFGPNGNIPEFSSYSKVLFANPAKNSQAQQSPFLAFRSYTGAAYDDWSFESFVSGSGSQLSLVHSKGTSTNNWFVAEGKTSGITLGTIATPSAPGVNVAGTGGSTTYTYSVVDFGPNGNTLASATTSTAVGNASLSSSNYNQITFGFQFGTTRVCIRREVGGATQGIIGCVPVAAGNQAYSTQDNGNQYEFHDTGLTGDSSVAPALNTTGVLDASLSPYIFLPLSAGYVATAQGNIGYDTTNKNWHVWQNAADRLMAVINGAVTNNDCAKFVVSGSTVSLQDAGACGAAVWSSIGNPAGNLALTMGANTSTFNTTTAVSQFFKWANTTAALVGASQSSPALALCGTEWHSAASAEGCLALQFVPGTGTDAANTVAITHTGSATGTTTTTFPGPIQAGSSGGIGGNITLPEGTVPSASAGNDVCYGDSTAHAIMCSYNNGTFQPLTVFPRVVATVSLTSQNAAISTTTGYAVPAGADGLYQVCQHMLIDTIGVTGTSGTINGQFTWTDRNAVTKAFNVNSAIAGTSTQNVQFGCMMLQIKGSTNIQYAVQLTNTYTTFPVYDYYVTVTRYN